MERIANYQDDVREKNEAKRVVSFADTLKKFMADFDARPVKPKGGINSDRAYAVLKLMEFMGEDRAEPGETPEARRSRYNKRFKYWLGRTRHIAVFGIWRLMGDAKEGKNKAALLNHILKTKYPRPVKK